jgi:hypothetical protein
MSPVNKGDVIVFPLLTEADKTSQVVTIKWQQNLRDRSEQFYALTATNKNSSECAQRIHRQ